MVPLPAIYGSRIISAAAKLVSFLELLFSSASFNVEPRGTSAVPPRVSLFQFPGCRA